MAEEEELNACFIADTVFKGMERHNLYKRQKLEKSL